MSVYDFTTENMDGEKISLTEFKGKVLIIVNTAQHGLNSQYRELQEMYDLYASQDVEILGVDSNYPPAIVLLETLKKKNQDCVPGHPFTKFLIDRKGKVVGRYDRTVAPLAMKDDIENVLKKDA